MSIFVIGFSFTSENRHYVRACFYEAVCLALPFDSFDSSMLNAPSTAHFTAELSLGLYTFALITSCHSRGSVASWKYKSAAHQTRRTAYCSRVSTTQANTCAVRGILWSFCRKRVIAPKALPMAVLVTCTGRPGASLRREAAALTAAAYSALRLFQSTLSVGR